MPEVTPKHYVVTTIQSAPGEAMLVRALTKQGARAAAASLFLIVRQATPDELIEAGRMRTEVVDAVPSPGE